MIDVDRYLGPLLDLPVPIGDTEILMHWATDVTSFARASEAAAVDPRSGWAWYDTGTPWPASNVKRILADGALLIEGARTNMLLHSDDLTNGSWSTGAGTATGGQADPAGGTLGARIQVNDNAGVGKYQTPTAPHDTIVSAYVKASGATPVYSIGSATLAAAGTKEVSGTPTAGYQRVAAPVQTNDTGYTLVANAQGSGTWTGSDHAHEAMDAIYYGVQNEAGEFPSSFIRSGAGSATRAVELAAVTSVPQRMRTSDWKISVWPEFASGEAPATAYILHADASNYLALISGTTLRLRANGVNYDVTGLSYARLAELTIEVRFVSGKLIVNGGSPTTVVQTWATVTSTVHVGSDGAANALFGAIGLPLAA